jgi:predicted Zn-dependent peptidase
MYKKITLKNGLRIITVPQSSTRAATCLVLVGTGSKYERKEISGISHFLEHMLFKGTKKRPRPIDVAEPLDKIGGIFNAFTGEDYTGYFAKVASEQLDLALDWVSDIYLNSLLPEREIKKEKGVLIEEINMHFDHPTSYVGILRNKVLYGDQPAGWDIVGTKESVSRIGRSQLLDYMKSQYIASNTIVCLSGKIKNSHVLNKVKNYFSEIRTGQPKKKPEVKEKQSAPNCLLHFRKTDQTHFCLGVRGYNIFHPQRFTQEILAVILGGMMSSRLFIEIRERLGMAYYIKASSESNPDTGYLVVQAGVDNQRAEKAIAAVLKEFRKISQKKIPKTELKKAKDHIKGKLALFLESSDALASFYATQELFKKEILTPEQIYAKIDKVSIEDILRVARDIFQPQKLNLSLIGPFKDQNQFKNILKL